MRAPDDLPAPHRLLEAMDATWPAAETRHEDGWTIRRGGGGGKRVSAASPIGAGGEVAAAEAAMDALGQPRLFRIAPGDEALDAALAARGYEIIDPVVIYAGRAAEIDDGQDQTARVIRVSGPLALVGEIWAAGGIGPGRRAVMERAPGPKTVLMARNADRPAGVAFVAVDRELAMIHAIEVATEARRRGAGTRLMRGAARFALEAGAVWLALAVTEANAGARALYARLGMAEAARYHYRIQPGGPPA